MNNKVKKELEDRLTEKEVLQIETFLNNGFSEKGEILIARSFLHANDHQKSVEDVLAECVKQWRKNWGSQCLETRADIEARGDIGVQNRLSLENIYSSLGIRYSFSPKISGSALIVTTRDNSVYQFGEADREGIRTVSCDKKTLDFTECRILSLFPGESMELECLGATHSRWFTSEVLSIK